ncbi:MAG: hypothetical protein JSR46_05705 [Verrucomicrobia bacterium]|nr:hypothetical protein [Verrucomicrobiota bacterium]
MNKPYYVTAEGPDQGTYVRIGAHTLKANAAMIEELRWQARGLHFETMLHYRTTPKDLDNKKIRAFLSSRPQQKSAKISETILKAYQLIGQEHAKHMLQMLDFCCLEKILSIILAKQ